MLLRIVLLSSTYICGNNFESVISEHMFRLKFMGIREISVKWIPQNTFEEKSILPQVWVGPVMQLNITLANADPAIQCVLHLSRSYFIGDFTKDTP